MPFKKTNIYGLKQANPLPITTYFPSQPRFNETDLHDFHTRANQTQQFMNQISTDGKIDTDKLQPFQYFGIGGFYETGQLNQTLEAMQDITSDTDYLVIDTETLGTSRYTSQGSNQSFDFFDMPQISARQFKVKNGQLVEGTSATLANQIDQTTIDKSRFYLNRLKENPQEWLQMNDTQRRSLIDMTLYADNNFFERQTINGIDAVVMTGQPVNKIRTNASVEVVQSQLSAMERGLNNVSQGLVNTNETTLNVLDSMVNPNTKIVTQNGQLFDIPALQEKFGSALNTSLFGQRVSDANIDILPLAQHILGKDVDYTGENFQLETVYSNLFPNKPAMQSHFAGDDTRMTAEIFTGLLTREGESIQDNIVAGEILPRNSNTFVARQGMPWYNPTSYNRGRNKYSFVMQYDPDTKKFIPSNNFQESTIVSGHEYRPLGYVPDYEIEGVKHHALILEDLTTETHNVIMDADKNRLSSIFTDRLLEPVSDLSQSEIDYRQRDNSRRFLEGLFDSSMRSSRQSSVNQITEAYDILNDFDNLRMQYGDNLSAQDEQSIIDQIYKQRNESFLAQRKPTISRRAGNGQIEYPNYWQKSRSRIENVVRTRDVLRHDQDVYQEITKQARTLFPDTDNFQGLAQQNIFVEKAYKNFLNTNPIETPHLGHDNMKLFGINMSVLGETNYIDVSSPKKHQGSLRRLLTASSSESKGTTLNKFRIYLDNLGDSLDGRSRNEMEILLRRDIEQKGYISNRTLESISNRTFNILERNDRLIQGIPTSQTGARMIGAAEGTLFATNLVANKSEFMESVIQPAKEDAARRLLHPTSLDDLTESDALFQHVKRTEKVARDMDAQVFANNKIFNLDGGEIRKEQQRTLNRDVDIFGKIKEIQEAYQNNNMDTILFHDPNSDESFLAYTFRDKNINLATMDATDLYNNPNIGVQPLPLFAKNNGISVGSGTIAHEYRINFQPTNVDEPIRFTSNQDTIFDTIKNEAYRLNREYERINTFDTEETAADIIAGSRSRVGRLSRENASATAFSSILPVETVQQTFSDSKAYNTGFTVDGESIFDNYIATKRPDLWQQWQDRQQTNGRKTNLFNDVGFWMQNKESKDSNWLQAITEFNRTVSQTTGVEVTTTGLNAEQFRSGKLRLRDARASIELGRYNSAPRELIIKAENYESLDRQTAEDYYRRQLRQRYRQSNTDGQGRLAITESQLNERVERSMKRYTAQNSQLGVAQLGEVGSNSTQLPGLNMRTAFMNDQSLYKQIEKATTRIDGEITDLRQRLVSADDFNRPVLQNRIDELERYKNTVKNLSVHDGQSLLRKTTADNMVTHSQRTITVGRNETLPDQLLERIAQEQKADWQPGMDLGLKNDTYYFEQSLNYRELKKMGLLDPDDNRFLTVGKLMEYDAADKADGAQRRITKGTKLIGIGEREGRMSLILEQTDAIKTGDKLLGTQGAFRLTTQVVEDELFDYLGVKGADLITDSPSVGKNALGANINILLNTTYQNIAENLEETIFQSEADLDRLLPGTRDIILDGLGKGKYTVQDLNNLEIQQGIIDEAFLPLSRQFGLYGPDTPFTQGELADTLSGYGKKLSDIQAKNGDTSLANWFAGNQKDTITVQDLQNYNIEGTGLDEVSMYYNPESNRYDLTDVGYRPEMVGERGQSNYRRVYQSVVDDYGFDPLNAVVATGKHNVADYAGTGTRATYTQRERVLLDIKQTTDNRIDTSPIHQKLARLHQAEDKTEFKRMGRAAVRSAYTMNEVDDIAAVAKQQGNVIFDLTGTHQATETANLFLDETTGTYMVDAISMGRIGQETEDRFASLANPDNVRIFNDELGIDTTLGEFVEGDYADRVFLKTQDEANTLFNQTYVPIMPNIDDPTSPFQESHLREINQSYVRVHNAAYDANTLSPNPKITASDVQADAYTKQVDSLARRVNNGLDDYRDVTTRFVTNSQRGGLIKNLEALPVQHGGVYNAATLNQMVYQQEGAPRMTEVFMNRKEIGKQINGLELNILKANNLTDTQIEAIGPDNYQNYILDQITGSQNQAETDFSVYGMVNRNPSQSTGNMQYASFRVQNELAQSNMQLSPAFAEMLRADYDGDKIYSNLDFYRSAGDSIEEMKAMQSTFARTTQSFEEALNTPNNQGVSRVQALFGNVNEDMGSDIFQDLLLDENINQFTYYNDKVTFAQEYLVNYQKSSLIGRTDNIITSARQGTNAVYQSAFAEGVIDRDQLQSLTREYDEVIDEYMQGFISAKKVSTQATGLDFADIGGMDMFGALSEAEQTELILDRSNHFMQQYDRAANILTNPTAESAQELVDLSVNLGFISDEEATRNKYLSAFQNYGRANQTLSDAGYGGFSNPGLNLGRSSGDARGNMIRMWNEGNLDQVVLGTVSEDVTSMLGLASPERIAQQKELQQQSLAKAFSYNQSRESVTEVFADSATEQFKTFSQAAKIKQTMSNAADNISLSQVVREGMGSVMDSNAFKVGAGFAGMWMLGSALKEGPTPEGNEAQQEATPEEVSPAALLTSPTARVTPRGENVNINVQGAGNIDPQMLAGVVNQEIANQTGVPMEMNINQYDNVQKLDSKFYEDALSRILGI